MEESQSSPAASSPGHSQPGCGEETLLKKQRWRAVPEGGSEVRLWGLAEGHEPGCGLTGVSWKDGHLIPHGPCARATGLQAWGSVG